MSSLDLDPYQILDESPTSKEHYDLRRQAGLTSPPIEEATLALALASAGSVFTVVVRTVDDGKAVGMGRVIGDGLVFLQVRTVSHSSYIIADSKIFRARL